MAISSVGLFGRRQTVRMLDTAGILYLLLPSLLFFATFVEPWIAIPSVSLLLLVMASAIWRAKWNRPRHIIGVFSVLALTGALLVLSGAGALLPTNGDWVKHYAVVNHLVQRSWPPLSMTVEGADLVLRYALGWYLVPSALASLFGPQTTNVFMAAWTGLGLTIFFLMLADMRRPFVPLVAIPLVFMLVSGWDSIGTVWSGFRINTFHLEWWSGWMEYPSSVTSLVWTPQHTLPAWLATALLLRQVRDQSAVDLLAPTFFGLMLWSPFAALGLIPASLAFAVQTRSVRAGLNAKAIASLILIGVPIALYLTSGSTNLPAGLIWQSACIVNDVFADAPCATIASYALVIALEVAPLAIVSWFALPQHRAFTVAATMILVLLPLVRFGEWNDLVMRGSAPALALLAIGVAVAVVNGTGWLRKAGILVVLVGLATPIFEVANIVSSKQPSMVQSTFADIYQYEKYRDQYFAPAGSGILRTKLDRTLAVEAVSCRDLDLTDNGTLGDVTLAGFGRAEPHGRWTLAASASISCWLPEGSSIKDITIKAVAFVPAQPGTASVQVNDGPAVPWTFPGSEHWQSLDYPIQLTGPLAVTIRFDVPFAISPKDVGMSGDTRTLGLAVQSVDFD